MSANRSSMRSIDKAYDGIDDRTVEHPTLRSLDISRGIHSSHSSIDRKRGIDEMSVHSVSRAYDQTYYNGHRNVDENSIRSFNVKRGSDLSLRSDDPNRYGFDRESRRGSDASVTLLGSTLPLQRRHFYGSNENVIANISESE